MNDNQIRQYELEEAKKRMGSYTNTASYGMTNTAAGSSGPSNMNQLKSSEKLQAKEDINNYNTMY